MHRKTPRFGLLLALIWLSSCAPDLEQDNPALDADGNSKRAIARFDIQGQTKIPFPTFLVQKVDAESGEIDGQLQIPGEGELYRQINEKSGYTQLPVITLDFSADIAVESIKPGKNLIILQSDISAPNVDFSVEYDATYKRLFIYPKQSLGVGALVAVILTKSILGANGLPIEEDLFFHLTKFSQPIYDKETGTILSDLLTGSGVSPDEAELLEGLRNAYQENFYGKGESAISKVPFNYVKQDYASSQGIKDKDVKEKDVIDHIAIAWAFQTSKIDPTELLKRARTKLLTTSTGAFEQYGAMISGTALDTYYETIKTDFQREFEHDHIHGIVEGTIRSLDFAQDGVWPETLGAGIAMNVPAMIVFPKSFTEAGSVPVVIMQHGLSSCKRAAVLAVANALAAKGFAVAGIDAVGHGDRTLVNTDTSNDSDEPGLCSRLDAKNRLIASAEGFLNLDDLAKTRDAFRQSVIDLVSLRRALNSRGDFETVSYAGQSMGGLLGAILMGVEKTTVESGSIETADAKALETAVLNVPPGWLSRTYTQSPEFAKDTLPAIGELLGETDITSETFQDTFVKLLPLAQGLIDEAEPVHYFKDIAKTDPVKRILIQEVVDDLVALNAGTDLLAHVGGIEVVTGDQTDDAEPSGMALWEGTHHGVLTQADAANVTETPELQVKTQKKMQDQLVRYLSTCHNIDAFVCTIIFQP